MGLGARRSNDVMRAGLVGLRRRTDLRASRRSRLEALPHWARLSAAHTRIGPRSFRSVCRCYQEMAARCTISWRRPFIALRQSRQASRSEEHTSELQSHSDLVCRLLLEKKKKKKSQKTLLM